MVAASSAVNGNDRHLRKSLRAVREDIDALSHDVSQLAEAVRDDAAHRVRALRHDAAERMRSMADTARSSAGEAVSELQDRVRESPAIALGAAAGAGLLIGLLLARR